MGQLLKKDPMVSVVMSCYNHQKYVKEGILSVLCQTYTNFEFLIADDGSTDGSADVIRSVGDERIVFFEHSENTAFGAWEQMNCMAKGKYIAYIGSDDVWREDKLEKQVEFLETHLEYEACFTWVETIDGNSKVVEDKHSKNPVFNLKYDSSAAWHKKLFMDANHLAAPSFLMKTEVFKQLGGFNFKYRQLQDYELWLRYLQNHKLYVIPEKLLFYRWHEGDGTANISAPSDAVVIRTCNETYYMYSELIEAMSDACFLEVFGNQMLNRECSRPEEVMCEKFFLMINHPRKEAQQCGIDYYFRHIDEQGFKQCLEEQYGFLRADFYVMEVNRGIMKEMRDLETAVEQSKELANTAISYLKELQKQR